MTLVKAVEVLTELDKCNYYHISPDEQDAIKLGLEALKDLKLARNYPCSLPNPHLPGETVEGF